MAALQNLRNLALMYVREKIFSVGMLKHSPNPHSSWINQPAPSATLRVLPLHGMAAAPGQTPQQRLSRYKTKRMEQGADDTGWRALRVLSTEH